MSGISVLGSTGSIGCNTLDVIDRLGRFRVVALSAGRNMAKLVRQIERFRPVVVSVEDDSCRSELEALLHGSSFKPLILTGPDGMTEVATRDDVDTVVSATVGAVGFVPTLRAVEAGKRVALANKETLVIAGELITAAAVRSGAEVLPVDSEHNAIHQCLRGERRDEVKRLILTASGGPFRTRSQFDIAEASVADALAHPNWSMGDKITIDSATLMNKGFEVLEARWLFGFGTEQIAVVVHPQSVVHSMVEMIDGSVIAQMGVTDMRHPIQYALTYPERLSDTVKAFDITAVGTLTFEEPDLDRFPCLGLAYEADRAGGTMPAVLNAANEVAVEAFLRGEVIFGDIPRINRATMNEHIVGPADSIERVLAADAWARERAIIKIGRSAVAV